MGYGMSMKNSKFHVKTENFGRVYAALQHHGYVFEVDSIGNVTGIEYVGEILSNEEEAFAKIAPYVESGSYLEMCGEDGERFRWIFNNGTFKEIIAKTIWDNVD